MIPAAICRQFIPNSSISQTSDNGKYFSSNYTPASIGTYRYTVAYTGDTGNTPSSVDCTAAGQVVTVSLITTSLTAAVENSAVALGQPMRDVANLSGAQSPVSGTLTFTIYGPNDSNCSKSPINTEVVSISSNGAHFSSSYTPVSVGSYRYTAAYSGDSTNAASVVDCTAANQTVTVSVATTSLTAGVVSPAVALGQPIRDAATLSGAQSPVSGGFTFKIYGPNDTMCSKAAIKTEFVNISSNGEYFSSDYTPASAGTYRYTVAYTGDTGNTPSSVDCTAAHQTVQVNTVTWVTVRVFTVARSRSGLSFYWRIAGRRGIAGFNVCAGTRRLNHAVISVHRRPDYTYRTVAVSGRYHLSVIFTGGRKVDVGLTAPAGR